MSNFYNVADVLFEMKEVEAREKLLVCLRDQLPTCPFCGSWKVIQAGNTDWYHCHECGAETIGLLNDLEYSGVEGLINAALQAIWNLSQCGYCELENLARQILETLEEWPAKITLPCPKCGNDKIICSSYPFRFICTECQTSGPTGQSQKEAMELWNTRRDE